MNGPLEGKVALVTGASSGIGEAIAVALDASGVRVALFARRADRLNALVERIASEGGEAIAIAGDGADEAAAVGAVRKTIEVFGKIDILVNAAGIIQASTLADADLDEYRRVIGINLMAAVYTCSAAAGPMQAQGSGDIITISSMAARKTGSGRFSSYGASKHAVNAMTESLRQELGLSGVRVCTIMPGATTTEVGDNISDPAAREFMQAHVSKDGAMKPEDVADAVLFMLTLPRRTNVSEMHIRPTIDIG